MEAEQPVSDYRQFIQGMLNQSIWQEGSSDSVDYNGK